MLPLKNLLRRKARSLFAVLQIAVAIAAFVSIVGVTQGLRGQFYKISQVFAFDLIVQPDGAASPIFSTITREEAALIEGAEGVEAVSLLGIHFARIEALAQPIGLMAMDPNSPLVSLYEITRGRTLQASDTHHVLVGEVMAQDLGLDVSALRPDGTIVGDPPKIVLIGDISFEVVGIFRTPLDEVPFLSGQGIMPLPYFESQFKRLPNLLVAHTAPGRRTTKPSEVRAGLERGAQIAPRITAVVPRLKAKTIEAFLDTFKQAELVDSFALAISFLAALVSGIGVANTMLMSVFDRTREIGLLRAIGWSRWRIIGMIEAEGFILSLVGGLLGLPCGLVLIQASKLLIQLGWLSVSLDGALYGQAVAVAVGIGVVGSFYPAVRAANLQPTEALRYE